MLHQLSYKANCSLCGSIVYDNKPEDSGYMSYLMHEISCMQTADGNNFNDDDLPRCRCLRRWSLNLFPFVVHLYEILPINHTKIITIYCFNSYYITRESCHCKPNLPCRFNLHIIRWFFLYIWEISFRN